MTAVPILETERLILRGWRAEDLDAYAEMFRDPETTRFISKLPTRQEAWRNMAMVIGHWSLHGYGPWAVERRSDGALIGRIGYWNPADWPALELIWAIGKNYWRNGYATEAASAALKHGFEKLHFPLITSHIDPENFPSQGVAKRLGQAPGSIVEIPIGNVTYHTVAWEISRGDWAKNHPAG
jgi:RimJ/RimL family protein N-acetyltransferase